MLGELLGVLYKGLSQLERMRLFPFSLLPNQSVDMLLAHSLIDRLQSLPLTLKMEAMSQEG